MKHITFAAALAAATALSGAAFAEGASTTMGQGANSQSTMQPGAATGGSAGMNQAPGTGGWNQGAASQGQQPGSMNQSAGLSGDSLNEDEVRQVQQALKDQGRDIEVDGEWDDQTAQALHDYQQENDLMPSGELDDRTIAELGVDVGPQRAEGARQGEAPRPLIDPSGVD